MAKSKMFAMRPTQQRTTWTRFRLARGQDWPIWSTAYSDTYLGPLADVAGREKVRLGRMVEDPEQAAFIVRKCILLEYISRITR